MGKHAGQRRDTRAHQITPREQVGIDEQAGRFSWLNLKAKRTGDRRTIEQGKQTQPGVTGRRANQPELAKSGELLRRAPTAVKRQSARRQAVGLIAPDKSEIRRAQKNEELIVHVGPI